MSWVMKDMAHTISDTQSYGKKILNGESAMESIQATMATIDDLE